MVSHLHEAFEFASMSDAEVEAALRVTRHTIDTSHGDALAEAVRRWHALGNEAAQRANLALIARGREPTHTYTLGPGPVSFTGAPSVAQVVGRELAPPQGNPDARLSRQCGDAMTQIKIRPGPPLRAALRATGDEYPAGRVNAIAERDVAGHGGMR